MSMAMCPICMMDVGHNSDECMCNCHDAGYANNEEDECPGGEYC